MNKHVSNRKVGVTIAQPREEQTRFGHIALIAGLCFVVGVSWPFLAGVKLVPTLPATMHPLYRLHLRHPQRRWYRRANRMHNLPLFLVRTTASVELEKTVVISCDDQSGRKQSHCDKPPVDEKLSDHFKSLVACKPGTVGKLSSGSSWILARTRSQRSYAARARPLTRARSRTFWVVQEPTWIRSRCKESITRTKSM